MRSASRGPASATCAGLIGMLGVLTILQPVAAKPPQATAFVDRPTDQAPPATDGQAALAYLCSQMSGANVSAPLWKSEPDGAGGQDVRIVFGGTDARSSVTWRRGASTYYEANGAGFLMGAGFAIVVLEKDRIETYVYSAGNTELLFSSTRAGSQVLPNSVKAFRGTCVPDGAK